MWPGRGFGTERNKPDTRGPACMTDCRLEARIASSLPDHARNAHGNLLLQNRVIGPVRGVPTAPGDFDFDDAETGPMLLARESGCLACHGVAQKIVGPGFAEVALRYRNQDVAEALAGRVRQGAQGVWGNVPMPPQPDLKDDEIRALVGWILAGAPEK